MVWPKFTKRVSLDLGHHAKSNISNFPMSAIFGIGHFEFCRKMLYLTNDISTLTYRYETRYATSAPCPLMVLKKFGATLWSKVIRKFLKMLITFAYISLL